MNSIGSMNLKIVISALLIVFAVVAGIILFAGDECGTAAGCGENASILDRLFGRQAGVSRDGSVEPIATQPLPEIPPASKRPAAQSARAVPDAGPSDPAVPMTVDGLSASDQYDILKWNLVAYRSGTVDIVRTEAGAAPADGVLTLKPGDLVVLAGWAGHPAYGLRFRDVLLSLCGKVVGRAAVQAARPDVASAVHPNLGHSGWSAKLAADQLPRCREQVLQAWGVAPIGHNIFPLNGSAPIRFEGVPAPEGERYRSRAELLTPERNGVAVLKKIAIRASALRIRKCGGTGCEVVGRIEAGSYEGYILETVGDWTLFQIGETVGWVSSKYLGVS